MKFSDIGSNYEDSTYAMNVQASERGVTHGFERDGNTADIEVRFQVLNQTTETQGIMDLRLAVWWSTETMTLALLASPQESSSSELFKNPKKFEPRLQNIALRGIRDAQTLLIRRSAEHQNLALPSVPPLCKLLDRAYGFRMPITRDMYTSVVGRLVEVDGIVYLDYSIPLLAEVKPIVTTGMITCMNPDALEANKIPASVRLSQLLAVLQNRN